MSGAKRLPWALLVWLALTPGDPASAANKAPDPLESAKVALRTRDYPTALAKLQQGATAGNAQAQLLLGLAYLNGVGTKVDQATATSWLAKSAAQGNATAAYVMAALRARRSDAAPGEALALLHKAATLGSPEAVEDLRVGRMPLSPEWVGLADSALRSDLAIYSARNADLDCLQELGIALKDLRDPFGGSPLAHAVAAYPLDGCVVSGDKFDGGAMGKPKDFIYKTAGQPDRLVRLCCNDCVKDFNKEPAKYLKTLDEAVAAKAGK